MGRTTLIAVAAAAVLGGCGATKTITATTTNTTTVTETTTETQTIANTGASGGRSGYESTYPSSFEDSFATHCTAAGGTKTACACALKNIEETVPYSKVLAATRDIVTGNPPAWYTDAEAKCVGQ